MSGHERTVAAFEKVAHKSPEEIIGHFREVASRWLRGAAPDDDMTFLVMRMKAASESE